MGADAIGANMTPITTVLSDRTTSLPKDESDQLIKVCQEILKNVSDPAVREAVCKELAGRISTYIESLETPSAFVAEVASTAIADAGADLVGAFDDNYKDAVEDPTKLSGKNETAVSKGLDTALGKLRNQNIPRNVREALGLPEPSRQPRTAGREWDPSNPQHMALLTVATLQQLGNTAIEAVNEYNTLVEEAGRQVANHDAADSRAASLLGNPEYDFKSTDHETNYRQAEKAYYKGKMANDRDAQLAFRVVTQARAMRSADMLDNKIQAKLEQRMKDGKIEVGAADTKAIRATLEVVQEVCEEERAHAVKNFLDGGTLLEDIGAPNDLEQEADDLFDAALAKLRSPQGEIRIRGQKPSTLQMDAIDMLYKELRSELNLKDGKLLSRDDYWEAKSKLFGNKEKLLQIQAKALDAVFKRHIESAKNARALLDRRPNSLIAGRQDARNEAFKAAREAIEGRGSSREDPLVRRLDQLRYDIEDADGKEWWFDSTTLSALRWEDNVVKGAMTKRFNEIKGKKKYFKNGALTREGRDELRRVGLDKMEKAYKDNDLSVPGSWAIKEALTNYRRFALDKKMAEEGYEPTATEQVVTSAMYSGAAQASEFDGVEPNITEEQLKVLFETAAEADETRIDAKLTLLRLTHGGTEGALKAEASAIRETLDQIAVGLKGIVDAKDGAQIKALGLSDKVSKSRSQKMFNKAAELWKELPGAARGDPALTLEWLNERNAELPEKDQLSNSEKAVIMSLFNMHMDGTARLPLKGNTNEVPSAVKEIVENTFRYERIIQVLEKADPEKMDPGQLAQLAKVIGEAIDDTKIENPNVLRALTLFQNQVQGAMATAIEKQIIKQVRTEMRRYEDSGESSKKSISFGVSMGDATNSLTVGLTLGASTAIKTGDTGSVSIVTGMTISSEQKLQTPNPTANAPVPKVIPVAHASIGESVGGSDILSFPSVEEAATYLAQNAARSLVARGPKSAAKASAWGQMAKAKRQRDQATSEAREFAQTISRHAPMFVSPHDSVVVNAGPEAKYKRGKRVTVGLSAGAGYSKDPDKGGISGGLSAEFTATRWVKLRPFFEATLGTDYLRFQVEDSEIEVVDFKKNKDTLRTRADCATALLSLDHEWMQFSEMYSELEVLNKWERLKDSLTEHYSSLTKQITDKEQELQSLQKHLESADGEAVIAETKSKIADVEGQLRGLHQLRSDLSDQHPITEQCLKLSHKVSEKQQQVDSNKRAIKLLKEQISRVKKSDDIISEKSLRKELARLESELKPAEEELKSLKSELAKQQGRIDKTRNHHKEKLKSMLNDRGISVVGREDTYLLFDKNCPQEKVKGAAASFVEAICEQRHVVLEQAINKTHVNETGTLKEMRAMNQELLESVRPHVNSFVGFVEDVEGHTVDGAVARVDQFRRGQVNSEIAPNEPEASLGPNLSDVGIGGLANTEIGSARERADLQYLREEIEALTAMTTVYLDNVSKLDTHLGTKEKSAVTGFRGLRQKLEKHTDPQTILLQELKHSLELEMTGSKGRGKFIKRSMERTAKALQAYQDHASKDEYAAFMSSPEVKHLMELLNHPKIRLDPAHKEQMKQIQTSYARTYAVGGSFTASIAGFGDVGVTLGFSHIPADPNPNNLGQYLNFQLTFAGDLPGGEEGDAIKQEIAGIILRELQNAGPEIGSAIRREVSPHESNEFKENFKRWGAGVAKAVGAELAARGSKSSAVKALGVGVEIGAPSLTIEANMVKVDTPPYFIAQYGRFSRTKSTSLSTGDIPMGAVPVGTVSGKISAKSTDTSVLLEVMGGNTLTYIQSRFDGWAKQGEEGLEKAWDNFTAVHKPELKMLFNNLQKGEGNLLDEVNGIFSQWEDPAYQESLELTDEQVQARMDFKESFFEAVDNWRQDKSDENFETLKEHLFTLLSENGTDQWALHPGYENANTMKRSAGKSVKGFFSKVGRGIDRKLRRD